jgi:hypothetical protein
LTFDQHPLAKVHFDRNRLTRGDWQPFAKHRQRVSELLMNAAGSHGEPTLCVLGAGNGNDLDLSLLSQRYRRITLVDIDRLALENCLARQVNEVQQRIELIGDVDLSGLLAPLERTFGGFDVVASTCLLTQLIDMIAPEGSTDAGYVERVLAVRDQHLKLICDSIVSGGSGLLITDFVSSDTLPQLLTVGDDALEAVLAVAINQRNFFTGANPAVLAERLGGISHGVAKLTSPWRWQLGNRVYAVCAIETKNVSGS